MMKIRFILLLYCSHCPFWQFGSQGGQEPQLLIVRACPQLSVNILPASLAGPHSFPNREQMSASLSGEQRCWSGIEQTGSEAEHAPRTVSQSATVRGHPQLSMKLSAAVTAPHSLPNWEQIAASLSGVQHCCPTTKLGTSIEQTSGLIHGPHSATVRGCPQLSVPLACPHSIPAREQKSASLSVAQHCCPTIEQLCGGGWQGLSCPEIEHA